MQAAAATFGRNVILARETRNRYIDKVEKGFQAMNVLLLVFGAIIVITGVVFVTKDVNRDGYRVDGVEEFVLTIIFLFALVISFYSCCGLVIVKKRACHPGCVALYGTSLFLVVFLVTMIQGAGFVKLGAIEADEI